MKRLLKVGDARKLVPSGLGLNAGVAKQAIEGYVNNPTYGGMKDFLAREGNSYASYGLISDDYNYIFESYEFINNRKEKYCAIVVAPVSKISDGTISAADLGVTVFRNKDEVYRIGEIKSHLNGVSAADGAVPTFNKRNTTIKEQPDIDNVQTAKRK
jgi:hypothetical protein